MTNDRIRLISVFKDIENNEAIGIRAYAWEDALNLKTNFIINELSNKNTKIYKYTVIEDLNNNTIIYKFNDTTGKYDIEIKMPENIKGFPSLMMQGMKLHIQKSTDISGLNFTMYKAMETVFNKEI